ncbi:MAG: ATP-binding protein [Candidatus Kapaibacterium sp.]
MKRKIININEELCDGCGLCVPECKEGALQIIEGKARLISDLFCDGLGACIGHCPQNAITIEEREAGPYDERKVLDSMVKQPGSVLKAHLKHLKEHNAMEFFNDAIDYLNEKNIPVPELEEKKPNGLGHQGGGCPGSKMFQIERPASEITDNNGSENAGLRSELNQWPVQLHLVNPNAPYFRGSELVIVSTCAPLANPNIHKDYMKGRSVVVACPKLDYTAPYKDKLKDIYSMGQTPKVIILRMEVPCCGGLTKFACDAAIESDNDAIIVEEHVLTIKGELKRKEILINKSEKAHV